MQYNIDEVETEISIINEENIVKEESDDKTDEQETKNKIADFVSNPDNASIWYKNITHVEWKTDKKIAIGAKIAFKARFMSRKLAYIYEIVEFIPKEKMVMRTADGPFPMETTYLWKVIDKKRYKPFCSEQAW